MPEIPVEATAVDSDQQAVGRVNGVVLDPTDRRVTHIVLREASSSATGRDRLVPLARIVNTSTKQVTLLCTAEELAHFPDYQPVPWTFKPGLVVQSSDNEYVGEITAFRVKPIDDHVTHFMLCVWSTANVHEVMLPISALATARDHFPRLTLTHDQLDKLPGVPVEAGYHSTYGQPDAYRLVSIIFDTSDRADEAVRIARKQAGSGRLGRIELASVRKSLDGRLTIHEDRDLATGRGAVGGAVAGALLSLIAGPVGLVGATTLGAGAGALTAHLVDRGVPDSYVEDLGQALRVDSSAIVVLVHESFESALLDVLAPLGGQVLELTLSDEMLDKLIA